ncbi:MAG TPA: glycosyltransferase family 39 protein [Solirubrobacteraceae bacterium]|nr:glycosyltransferase family 39 protein [Solirubrobacteraceae bacterium]
MGAIALRAWLMLDYGPAFAGFGDSHEYVTAALVGVFHDVQKPAGYPIFLALVHLLSDSLAFTIVVQHVLGLATGVLLFASVRRTGAPAWLGLLPAAVVFFGGTGVLLEHALLGDCLFAFLQALGVYACVRALFEPAWRWPALAGAAIGASFWVKTVGISSAAVTVPLLALAAPGTRRRRLLSTACAGGVVVVLLVGYIAAQAAVTGYTGYERQGAWNLYGRVATFVNCQHFTPPAGTRFLCPSEPLGERQSESFYQYARAAPAVRRFGGPAHAPAYADALLERFSVAAIEHEPLSYAGAIVRALDFYISPRGGEGYTPQTIREALLETKGTRSIQPAISAYYPHDHGYQPPTHATSALDALDSYERQTRIQGPLLVALLALALAGVPALSGRMRAASLLFTLTALFSVTLAAAGNSYDARYGYPAFGPLAAAGALGAWALARRARARITGPGPVPDASA